MIETLENTIVARLAEKIPELENASYPDNPDSYQLQHPVGALLTRFESASHSTPIALDMIEQDVTLNFITLIVTRGYGGDGGAKAIFKRVVDAVRGYRVPGFSKFYVTKVELLQYNEGIWQYSVGIACVTRESELEAASGMIQYDEETDTWKDDIPQPD